MIEDRKTGYLYKRGDVQALAETIAKAVENSDKSREIAKNGQSYAWRAYTKERSIQKMLGIYEEVLGRTL